MISRNLVALGAVVAAALAGTSLSSLAQTTGGLRVAALSAKPHLVSGGDVLLRVEMPKGMNPAQIGVLLNGNNVTAAFRPTGDGALQGLLTGLKLGENKVVAVAKDGESAAGQAELVLTNWPVEGPIISGPHQQLFICQTDKFGIAPIPGSLGAAKDKNCSIDTRVDYVYVTKGNQWKALADRNARPDDLAEIAQKDGSKVPFIVRVETGTINRGIYQIAMVHDPKDPQPDHMTRSKGWDGRLLYTFGGGCQEGWYVQGKTTGGVLDIPVLQRGFAVASSSLNVFGNNCQDQLASETLMMVKEHFVEAYGVPKYTMGWGSSGGSYQQHQSADNYPGLLDSVMTGSSFSDVGFATVHNAADSWLLQQYFKRETGVQWSAAQQQAVAGFGSPGSIQEMTNRAQRINPYANWSADVPQELRYDRINNPTGARATIYDHAINTYGRDPKTGFARRPLDNVGVQYGLQTLNNGTITVDQFLDLNDKIGGFDIDAKYTPARMVADPEATRIAYETGRMLNGGGGLGQIPLVDYRTYLDLDPAGNVHQKYHSFGTRDRLIKANGNADNRVMLTEDTRPGALALNGHSAVWLEGLDMESQWLENILADKADMPKAAKVAKNKPKDLVDACWTPDAKPIKLVETQTYDGPGLCNNLYRAYSSPRMIAGTPLANDIIKCQLRPVDMADYKVPFTAEQQARLKRIFADGVCDWSKPGVGQVGLKGTWLSFGPSPVNLVK